MCHHHRDLLVALLLGLSALCSALLAQSCGDCNNDGRVSLVDALIIAQGTLMLAPLPPATAFACDVDDNSRVDIVDALIVAQRSAGLPTALICPTTSSSCRFTSPVPGAVVSGDVTLQFVTTDVLQPTVDLGLLYSLNGSPTLKALVPAPSSPPPFDRNPVLAQPVGSVHTLVWDSAEATGRSGYFDQGVTVQLDMFGSSGLVSCSVPLLVENYTLPFVRAFPGGIIVTEIHQEPMGVTEDQGEWFEVRNIVGLTLDLEGCVLTDDGGQLATIATGAPFLIAPGETLVFGINDDSGTNGNVVVDYEYAPGYRLDNVADEIVILTTYGTELARVSYDAGLGWPVTPGAAQMLDVSMTGEATDPASWCVAPAAWSGADLGSPGALNSACGVGIAPSCSFFLPDPLLPASGVSPVVLFGWPDPDSELLDITMRWSTDAGVTWSICTLGTPAPERFGMESNPDPVVAALPFPGLYWDTVADIGSTGTALIPFELEAEIFDGVHSGSCAVQSMVGNP